MVNNTSPESLLQSFLDFLSTQSKVKSANPETGQLFVELKDYQASALVEIDPNVLARGFARYASIGRTNWPNLPSREAAWVLLTNYLDEAVLTKKHQESSIELSESHGFVEVPGIEENPPPSQDPSWPRGVTYLPLRDS